MKEKQKKENKIKKFFADFKTFIAKGNVMQLAIAVVIGGAFGKIVSSFVSDMIMPLLGLVTGTSIDSWKWVIKPAKLDGLGNVLVAETALRYGAFLQTILDFLIIAFFIFMALKIALRLQKTFNTIGEQLQQNFKEERLAYKKELKANGVKGKDLKLTLEEFDKKQIQKDQEAKNEANRLEEVNKPETAEQLLKEIRDLLKDKKEK